MVLGKTISGLRKRKGLTRAELASLIEVHPSHVTRWEKGQVQPRTKTLEKLAAVLETTAQELLAGDLDRVGNTLAELDDPDLTNLFSQVHKLNGQERQAVKLILTAFLARIQVAEVIAR